MRDQGKISLQCIPTRFRDIINPKDEYRLVGVVRYLGDPTINTIGHYTAVCYRQKVWYEYNDLLKNKIVKLKRNSSIIPELIIYARVDK